LDVGIGRPGKDRYANVLIHTPESEIGQGLPVTLELVDCNSPFGSTPPTLSHKGRGGHFAFGRYSPLVGSRAHPEHIPLSHDMLALARDAARDFQCVETALLARGPVHTLRRERQDMSVN
jgi:hypothetical protein